MAGYNVEQFWKVKDKTWLTERKAKWKQLEALLKAKGYYKGTDIRLFEQYFVKGNLQVEDLRALDLGTRPELNLLFQLAWHPSTDTNVWLEVLAYNCTEFDSFKLGYDRLASDGGCLLKRAWYSPGGLATIFCDRDELLYHFFFSNPTLLAYIATRPGELLDNGKLASVDKAKGELHYSIKMGVCYYNSTDFESEFLVIEHSVAYQYLKQIADFYTSEQYKEDTSKGMDYVIGRYSDLADLYAARDHLGGARKKIAELWDEQLQQAAPEWQALWQQLKQDALANYQRPELKTQPEPEEPLAADTPEDEPWPDELLALKRHLEQQGYAVTTTEPSVYAIMEQVFADRSIIFGGFLDDLYLEDEDYERPYPAFTKPLKMLCTLKGDAKLSYARRGERVSIKVNDERIGVVDLDYPEGPETAAYFTAVVRLAQVWFAEQVFLYGDEMTQLCILPKELVAWLEANGFENLAHRLIADTQRSADYPLRGLVLVFTGTFGDMKRHSVEFEAEVLGARVQQVVTRLTDYLICGNKPGASKLAKAEELGVTVIDTDGYQALVSQAE